MTDSIQFLLDQVHETKSKTISTSMFNLKNDDHAHKAYETIFISFKEIQFDQLLPTAWR